MNNTNNINGIQKGKNILEIIYLEERKIRLRVSQSYKTESLSSYIENKIDLEDTEGSIREINGYLRKGNIFRNPDPRLFTDLFTEFQKACRLLHNELLSLEIKSSLQNSQHKDLEFILDAQLLHIPWELLFDGERFLCERFNTGRKIRIKERQINHSRDSEETTSPLKMLIIANPTGDLELAYKEGKRISNMINKSQKRQKLIIPDFQAYEMVTKDFIKKNLSDYDIIHYAGHVEYDPAQPQKGGWVLSDGILSAEDILKMINANAKMPCLIFVNACQSGNWPQKQSAPDAPYPFEKAQYKNAIIEFLFAERMLFLEVFKSGDDVFLWYKLDDVRKGESFKMDSLILTKKEDPSFLTERIYDQIDKEIHIKYPLRGRIVKVRYNIATLNIGTDVGVKKGDICEVFSDPNIAKERRKIIGRIEVMDDGLDPKEAQCKILIGDDLAIGQRVEISKDNPD